MPSPTEPTGAPPFPGEEQRIRVLIAKPGLDGHDRGAKVVARGLRDAGFEVIYTGLHRTPAQIVRAAVDEDVHVVGLSVLSGAHNHLLPAVVAGLRAEGRADVLVLAGGIIPEADVAGLQATGVAAVFGPGARIEEMVSFIRANVQARW
jgi:methylmalonyl-CoA mutase C-terminal domain/subunit